jgi:hypothetical protein
MPRASHSKFDENSLFGGIQERKTQFDISLFYITILKDIG